MINRLKKSPLYLYPNDKDPERRRQKAPVGEGQNGIMTTGVTAIFMFSPFAGHPEGDKWGQHCWGHYKLRVFREGQSDGEGLSEGDKWGQH